MEKCGKSEGPVDHGPEVALFAQKGGSGKATQESVICGKHPFYLGSKKRMACTKMGATSDPSLCTCAVPLDPAAALCQHDVMYCCS